MIRLGSYRPLYLSVVVVLLLSMAMPLVTYACDLTGLIETAVTMADVPEHDNAADCPCKGPMQNLCGSSASDCAGVVNCHGNTFDADACCSSQPEVGDAVASVSAPDEVQLAVSVVLPDRPVQETERAPANLPAHERAPPQRLKAPVHILHASLLL